jgi:hypothetical protein
MPGSAQDALGFVHAASGNSEYSTQPFSQDGGSALHHGFPGGQNAHGITA